MLLSVSKKIKSLFDTICMKTVLGDLKWDKTEISGIFQTIIDLYNVRIKDDEENHLNSYIEVYKIAGDKIIRMSPMDMGDQHYCDESSRWIEQAYRCARRQAMNVDAALDEIIKALKKMK